MARLRVAPSGPFIEGTQTGQILVWDHTTREWEPGAAPGGSSAFHARSFGTQDDPFAALALIPDSVLEFPEGEVPVGQALFVQSVVQVFGVNDGALTFELWRSFDGVTYAPFFQYQDVDVGFSEGSRMFVPLQGETDALVAPSPLFVGVAVGSTGILAANIAIAHIQAQPFTPIPD